MEDKNRTPKFQRMNQTIEKAKGIVFTFKRKFHKFKTITTPMCKGLQGDGRSMQPYMAETQG